MAISASVTPGKVFQENDTITVSSLNQLGSPSVDIQGAVGSLSISSNTILNTHVQASAAINFSKMENVDGGKIIVGNSSNVPTAVAMSGDATIDNAGAVTVSSSATVTDNAITLAKLEDGTQGDVLYYGADGAPARLGFGTSGQFLKTQGTGANPVWSGVEVPALVQVVSTGIKQIYNHSTGSYASVEGTQGDQDAFYVLTDDTNAFDTTITRKRLDSKVRIEFAIHLAVNTGRGWWGKIQRSLNDGTTWSDTVVGDEGPGGASDLRRRVQFGGEYLSNGYGQEQVSLCYIDTPAGSTGEEAVRYRIVVGTEAGYWMHLNHDDSEDRPPTGNGGTHLIRVTSTMLLTEVFV